MRKFTSRITMLMWALTLATIIRNVAFHKGFNHVSIDLTNPQGVLGWVLTITLVVTAFDYIYFHLIKPEKK